MKIGIAKLATVVLVLSAAMGISTQTFGQARPSSKNNVISINPLALAYQGPVELQYEFKSGPVNSWALRAELQPTRSDYSAFGLGAAYRFYIADSRALTGLSVAPAADVYFFSATGLQSFTIFDIGGDLAYKWIFDAFAIEPMLGLRIGFGGSQGVSYATGFLPHLALYLGYAF